MPIDLLGLRSPVLRLETSYTYLTTSRLPGGPSYKTDDFNPRTSRHSHRKPYHFGNGSEKGAVYKEQIRSSPVVTITPY